MADIVLRQLAAPFRLKKQEIFVKGSIGVVLGSSAYEHPDQILRDADNAMESTSRLWSRLEWKDKLAAGFTNSASQNGDKLNSLIQMAIFAMST